MVKGVRHITVVALVFVSWWRAVRRSRRGGWRRRPRRRVEQITDLAGSWANRLHEDWIERAPGPHIGDYSGLPINDEARAYADLYQVSMQNMPERQCILYTSQYIVMGPQNLRIEPDVDPISGASSPCT